MVLQRKSKTSLFELFEPYAGGTVPEVAIQTRPPTPLPVHFSQPDLAKEKDIVKKG